MRHRKNPRSATPTTLEEFERAGISIDDIPRRYGDYPVDAEASGAPANVEHLANLDAGHLAAIVRDLAASGASVVTLDIDDDGNPVRAVSTTDRDLHAGEIVVVIRRTTIPAFGEVREST